MTAMIPFLAAFTAGAAGAMGLGGGFVLMLYLSASGMELTEARAANLLFFLPTALVSMLINRKSGLTDHSLIPYAAAAGSTGAVAGLLCGEFVDKSILQTVFAILLITVGIAELFRRKEKDEQPPVRRAPAGR